MNNSSHHALTVALVALLLTCGLVAAPAFAQAPAGYYDSVDTSTGSALRSTLHNVIDDHQRFPYTSSSTDVWDILNQADQNPNNSGQIVDLYKNAAYNKISGGVGAYNREHSWPKSYGFPDDGSSNYPYTDCHHLFAADASYNSSRSNKPFDNCHSGCTERTTNFNNGRGGGSGTYSGNSNWTETDVWQTWAGRKGDVARAMFYMDIRYEGGNHGGTGVSEPDLRLTDSLGLIESYSTGNNEAVAYMGMLSVLLQWHAEDPVDSYETSRNNVVYSYQGNRNPFIDNPEWVSCIYQGTGCGTGGGGGGNTLANGVPKTGLSGSGGSQTFYSMSVPSGATNLSFQMSGGSGDADLYVKAGSQPSTSNYDCRPYLNGNNETCNFSSPSTGTYHVMVRGYSAYSGVSLVGSYTAGGGGGGGSCGDSATANNLSGSTGSWKNFEFDVDSCATKAVFKISGGSGDADLYTRFGSLPTTSSYDCRPYLNGNNETCTHNNPAAGTWRVSLRAYSTYSGVKLESSYE